jgi:hypothetical protein
MSCRHQAKLQHNLMYLAAIADSQPPQTAPLSQVLMLVGLALADLTPEPFSLVKSTWHRTHLACLKSAVPVQPDDAAGPAVHAAAVGANDEPAVADGGAVLHDVRAPVHVAASAAAGGARPAWHGLGRRRRRHDQRVQHPPRRGQHGRRRGRRRRQQHDERRHVLGLRPPWQRQRRQGGVDLAVGGRPGRRQLRRAERGRRVPEGRHRGGRQLRQWRQHGRRRQEQQD